jgi:hypothetical protein
MRPAIVDGAEQHEIRAARLEPGAGTAVDLHERTARRFGDAAAPGARRRLSGPAERLAETAHGLPADRQAVLFAQLLGQMAVIEADVARRHARRHGLLHLDREPPARGPAAASECEPAVPRTRCRAPLRSSLGQVHLREHRTPQQTVGIGECLQDLEVVVTLADEELHGFTCGLHRHSEVA